MKPAGMLCAAQSKPAAPAMLLEASAALKQARRWPHLEPQLLVLLAVLLPPAALQVAHLGLQLQLLLREVV
jgi:hypothetical protein